MADKSWNRATTEEKTMVSDLGDGTFALKVDGVISTTSTKGSKTRFAGTQPSTTAQEIFAANPDRIEAVFYNNGSQTVFLGKDNTVTSTAFFIAVPAGGSFVDEGSNDAWWGITASGTADMQGYEVA